MYLSISASVAEYFVPSKNRSNESSYHEETVTEKRKKVQVNIFKTEDGKSNVEKGKNSRSLLLTRAAGTEIIVTPTSRVNSMSDLSETLTESVDLNFLCPDLDPEN